MIKVQTVRKNILTAMLVTVAVAAVVALAAVDSGIATPAKAVYQARPGNPEGIPRTGGGFGGGPISGNCCFYLVPPGFP